MSKIDRRTVMARAWAIFRETYRYPSIPFRSIGRGCFGWALKMAWIEARKAARLAALSADAKAARIVELNDAIRFARFNGNWAEASREISASQSEIARLSI